MTVQYVGRITGFLNNETHLSLHVIFSLIMSVVLQNLNFGANLVVGRQSLTLKGIKPSLKLF